MKPLSNITNHLYGQPMFELLTMAKELERKGKSITHFEIGDPNFDAPQEVKDAVQNALDQNMTHYTNSNGLLYCREAVQRFITREYGFTPELNQILICPANAVIDFVIRCVANPCDGVLYPDPGFPTYHSSILYNGMTPYPYSLNEKDNWNIIPAELNELITPFTKLLIINSPHNPTGSVLPMQTIETLYDIATIKDLYLLSDEVYFKILYDKVKHCSPSIFDKCMKRVILLGSFSKIFAMSGFRLGYVIGPPKLIEKMNLLLQTIISCLPPFIQYAGAQLLDTPDIYNKLIDDRNNRLQLRRDTLVSSLNKITPKVFNCKNPKGSFYSFINIEKTGLTSNEYAKRLLEKTGVCVLPGDCFGDKGQGYIRYCFASQSNDTIKEAIDRVQIFHNELRKEKI